MNEEKLKAMLDKAEQMGFTRGVLTICTQILQQMEADYMTVVSYKSIKEIVNKYAESVNLSTDDTGERSG